MTKQIKAFKIRLITIGFGVLLVVGKAGLISTLLLAQNLKLFYGKARIIFSYIVHYNLGLQH